MSQVIFMMRSAKHGDSRLSACMWSNPVDEETIAGALFDELHDATDTLKVVHQVVGLATQFCSKSTKVIGRCCACGSA